MRINLAEMPMDEQDKQQICRRLVSFSEELGWTTTNRVKYLHEKYQKTYCIDSPFAHFSNRKFDKLSQMQSSQRIERST
jgi:hypothetical protein